MVFTAVTGYTTEVSGLKGSLWYNAGKVILDESTKLTGTGTLGGQAINVTLETINGDAYLDFSANGITYGAGTGALKITYTLGELESTFTVNSGSVFIGSNVFKIAQGSDPRFTSRLRRRALTQSTDRRLRLPPKVWH